MSAYQVFQKVALYGPWLAETQIQTDRRGNQRSVCQSRTIKPKCLLFPQGDIPHPSVKLRQGKHAKKQNEPRFGI